MVREISAGGVVIRKSKDVWWMAAIELPESRNNDLKADQTAGRKRESKAVLCLPKGLVDSGEKPLDAALREVREETGVTATPVTKLLDSKYVYQRSWGDGERVFKIVSFYLLRYRSGRIDNVTPEMRIEVARARWVRLNEAPKLLAYGGEKQAAKRALEYLEAHKDL